MSSQEQSHIPGEIPLRQIPKFEIELREEELINCIKQLSHTMKFQDKTIQKIKKDIEGHTTEPQIIEILTYINSLICVDPSLRKDGKNKNQNLGSSSSNKKQNASYNGMNSIAGELGKKLNQMSQIVLSLHTSIKTIQKKTADLQSASKKSLQNKIQEVEQELLSNNTKSHKQLDQFKQHISKEIASFNDKVLEIERKTLWQINDCKSRLNSCVNEQYVQDSIREIEGKIGNKIKDDKGRGSTMGGSNDYEKIEKVEFHMNKIEKNCSNLITQNNYKIQQVKDSLERVVSKKQFGDEKIEIEKRFSILSSSLSQTLKRIREMEIEISEQKHKGRKLQQCSQNLARQVHKIKEGIKNLQLGEDFIKMIEKIDPHKICQLVDRAQNLQLGQEKLARMIDICQKQVDRLRSKTQFTGMLSPTMTFSPSPSASTTHKLVKQQIHELIQQSLVNNPYCKKIQNLQSQIIELRMIPDLVNGMNKQIMKMEKDMDHQNLHYQYKALQQYIKKQILLVNNRINNIELQMKEEKKRAKTVNKMPVVQQKLSSSVSYKKLTPANCISCFMSSQLVPNYGAKKNLIQKL